MATHLRESRWEGLLQHIAENHLRQTLDEMITSLAVRTSSAE